MLQMLHTPWSVALFFGHFFPYAVVAVAYVAVRALRRKVTRKEWLLLFVFMALVVAEIVQLCAEGGGIGSFSRHEVWGLPRYFSSFSPLLWCWTAGALAFFLTMPCSRIIRRIVAFAIVAFLAFVLFNENIRYFSHEMNHGESADAMVAARRIAPVIRRDYAGPGRYAEFPYQKQEYFTSRRPVVFGNYGAAALAVRGQSEGANLGIYPYPPDYIFLNMNSGGYRGGAKLNPDDFEPISETRGMSCRWVLFRRKGVPHR